MFSKITRRAFIKLGMLLTGGVLSGARLGHAAVANPDISVVQGTNYFDNTIKAIDGLGGMDRIVSRGSKVGLLVNHSFMNIGAHVHPDMTVAIARMCFDAGASDVTLIKSAPVLYFRRARSGQGRLLRIDERACGRPEEAADVLHTIEPIRPHQLPRGDINMTRVARIDRRANELIDERSRKRGGAGPARQSSRSGAVGVEHQERSEWAAFLALPTPPASHRGLGAG